jgi:methionyl-tRNA formyltransferase
MGTPQFGKEFLEHIYLSKNFSVQAVYTQPPKKSNRGQKLNLSPVHKFAKENRINIFCPEKFSKIDIENIKKINPDVILVVAYGVILPNEVLSIPCCGCVNVHASLLPKWRGAAPIERSIMSGDTKTGISIMKVVEELDHGPVYLQSEISIKENDTYEEVSRNLINVGKKTLDMYFSGHLYPTVPQNHKLATYAKKIKKNELEIDFNNEAYLEHKRVCAFTPKPGACFTLDSVKYKIFATKFIAKDKIKDFNKDENLILSFKKDYLLIEKIQKEGKNIMSTKEFGRGYPEQLQKIKKKLS